MNIKNNLSLIFGISIPILMIIFVALSIYLPQLFVKPQYNFLYLIGVNTCSNNNPWPNNWTRIYSVENSKLIENQVDQGCIAHNKIFIHDIKNNQNKEISFNDAKSLILDSSITSSDGFEIVNGSNGSSGFFPFFSSSGYDYNSRYISGHNISKKINIQQTGDFYIYDFIFLGWVIK